MIGLNKCGIVLFFFGVGRFGWRCGGMLSCNIHIMGE